MKNHNITSNFKRKDKMKKTNVSTCCVAILLIILTSCREEDFSKYSQIS